MVKRLGCSAVIDRVRRQKNRGRSLLANQENESVLKPFDDTDMRDPLVLLLKCAVLISSTNADAMKHCFDVYSTTSRAPGRPWSIET